MIAIPIILIIIGVLILIHQLIVYGVFFTLSDFFHHEGIAMVTIFFGLGMMVSTFGSKR